MTAGTGLIEALDDHHPARRLGAVTVSTRLRRLAVGHDVLEVLEVPADVRDVVEEDGRALVVRIAAELRMSLIQAGELLDVASLAALVVHGAEVELSAVVFAVARPARQGTVGQTRRADAAFGESEEERVGKVRAVADLERVYVEQMRRNSVRQLAVVAQDVAAEAELSLSGLLVRNQRGAEEVGRPLRRKGVTGPAIGCYRTVFE